MKIGRWQVLWWPRWVLWASGEWPPQSCNDPEHYRTPIFDWWATPLFEVRRFRGRP